MPWKPSQRAAIAAKMGREGKSRAAISAFFHAHGHGGKKKRQGRRKRRVG